MRPLPKRLTMLGGTFEIITEKDNPALVKAELDDKDVGAVCTRRQLIFIRSNITLRTQWEQLIHEITHVHDDECRDDIEEKLGHEAIYRWAAFWTDLLERNGFLSEPHRRGFYKVPDIEPGTTGSCARMAEKLEGITDEETQ